jgi:hypothetical protein
MWGGPKPVAQLEAKRTELKMEGLVIMPASTLAWWLNAASSRLNASTPIGPNKAHKQHVRKI